MVIIFYHQRGQHVIIKMHADMHVWETKLWLFRLITENCDYQSGQHAITKKTHNKKNKKNIFTNIGI